MEEEYIQGTTKEKVKWLLYLSGGTLFYFALKYIYVTYIPEPSVSTDEAVTKYARDVANFGVALSVFMFFIYLYFSIKFYKYGKSIKENNQYQPPNTEIAFTRKIVRGDKALQQARASIFGSGLLIFIGVSDIGVSIYTATVLYDITNAF